ncbi:glucosamine-6-phosphate deaminase [Pullulanibacillus sp. KACC 23026]|uniref:glucosamine-6-phosphate deaminase n=1 Tax=Pullulanibacillus sp. KACC 23026 TaxID=3028315 RepID=UPI0023B1B4C0|nr:glucosamine-6-phosphate deaminase [Pullulanibacillus sp. KACC 23026]WEG13362.1 glucosamine-6-phosphate deaminase [Pullulanibacillus sp. KACC 23026]
MYINVFNSEEEVDRSSAEELASEIRQNDHLKLGLATGHTPIGLYKNLVKLYNNNFISFKNVTTYNIDEYIGLGRQDEMSFYSFMQEHLFSKVDLSEERIHIPNGLATDVEQEAERYEELLNNAGQLDVQVLSVGLNGHIGFNEPSPTLQAKTHVVELTEETRQVNSKDFSSISEVPYKAITMGIGTMMKAKKIVFIAKGEAKASILKQAFTGLIDPMVPGSLLQLHPNLHVYLDRQAASLLEEIL